MLAWALASLHLAPLTGTHRYWDAAGAGAPRHLDAAAGPEEMQRQLAEAVAGYAETHPDFELRLELAIGPVDHGVRGRVR